MSRPVAVYATRWRPDPDGSLPAFLAIARAIAEDARVGRLPSGSRLPSSRELAAILGVHRNTVLAAYRELDAEGFLSAEPGRATFVARSLPEVRPKRWSSAQATERPAARPHFPFERPRDIDPAAGGRPRFTPFPKNALALYGGVPDTRLVPREALARAYRRALRREPRILDYGEPNGDARLRAAIAEMLRTTRGLDVDAADVVVTRGTQMALWLLGEVLLRPGDVIAAEGLGYAPAWRALAHNGARLEPVAVDEEGLVVDALEALCDRQPVRAVYVTPHHQYPTTVGMSAGRRMALLALARRRRFAIIEDDYDHEFHYDGRPVLPLASTDSAGVVLYMGTFSKALAPGLRVGYLVAPPAVRDGVIAARFDIDRQGDAVGERALAELMEEGELQRHFWRVRRVYAGRRDHFVALVRARLGRWLDFEVPPGGMAIWTRVDDTLPVSAWHEEAAKRDVLFQPGRFFTWTGSESQHARLGFASLTERDLTTAVSRLEAAAKEVAVTPRGGDGPARRSASRRAS